MNVLNYSTYYDKVLGGWLGKCIGGACGALIAGWTGIGASAYGVTGLFGYLITTDYTLQYTMIIAVSAVIAFILSWALYKEEPAAVRNASDSAAAATVSGR